MLISCWNRILSSCKEAGFVIITRPDDVHSEPNPAVNSKGSIGWCLGRGLQCGRDSVRTGGVDGVEGSDAGVAMNLWTRTSQQHLLFVILPHLLVCGREWSTWEERKSPQVSRLLNLS